MNSESASVAAAGELYRRWRTELRLWRDAFEKIDPLVLEDLVEFCGYNEPIYQADPPGSPDPAVRDGRRQVFLHIRRRQQMTDDELDALAGEIASTGREPAHA